MPAEDAASIKHRLKQLIIDVCEKDCEPADITDSEALFGPDAPLALDSIDGLQLSMALERQFGVRLTDSKDLRRAFTNIDTLAAFLAVFPARL